MLTSFSYFREREFWKIVSMFDWQFVGDDKMVLNRAKLYLSKKSESTIEAFRQELNDKLKSLEDTRFLEMMLSNTIQGDRKNITTRHFLYTRCSVIATGQKYYNSVLENPLKMAENIEFGALLNLADSALKIKRSHGLDRRLKRRRTDPIPS
jgi:hypothetical protein